MGHINIEFHKTNRFRDLLNKIYNKIEDMIFSILMKIPGNFIPPFIMNHIERYLHKRLNTLKAQVIKDKWQELELQNTVDMFINQQKK